MSALVVDGVDVVRSQRYLLDSLDLRVERGEQWVVLGPNGAGKSTLLSLLGAHTHPTRGTVHVLGKQLGRVDMRELRTLIGHVDPRHRANSPITATEVVWTGLTNTLHLVQRQSPTDDVQRRARDLLDMVGMGERRDLQWSTMSQGERGRVLIARALMNRPPLLLLDEPSTGLDVAAREELLTLLVNLCAEMPELATVLVTHHLEEIPESASHALLLRSGRAVASGSIESTLTSDAVSECFDHPLRIERSEMRWAVRSRRTSLLPLTS